jgi:hypothetical protein
MPLIRRRRPLLRAAAVTGGAYAVGQHNARTQVRRQDEAYFEGQQAAMAATSRPTTNQGLTSESTSRLAELGRLHEQGVLTDEEFSQQKARILGIG